MPFGSTYTLDSFKAELEKRINQLANTAGSTVNGVKVDFDRYSTSQKFLGLKSLVLRNNTQDESNLHERLSMLLFQRMGFPASREAHTTLYVNNEYSGVYTIVETVDKTFLERTLGEDDGYLYEYEYPVGAQPYYFEYKGPDPAAYVPMPFKPDTHENDSRPEFIEQLVWTINETSSAVFRTAVSEYVDLELFLMWRARGMKMESPAVRP